MFEPLRLIERDSEPFSLIDWSRLSWGRSEHVLVTVTTDSGIEGHSSATPAAAEYLVAHKTQLQGGDWEHDVGLCKAIRAAVGDGMTLMLDPCMAYDRWAAMKVGREIDKLDFYWYEDPIPETDVAAYTDLCRSLDVALAEAEASGLRVLAESGRGVRHEVRASQLGQRPRSGRLLQRHAGDGELRLFRAPVSEGIMDQASLDVIRIDEEGYVSAPTQPGLGLRVDFDAIDRALARRI